MAEGIKTMEIKKIEMNGKVYEFVNETKDTRHGFAHVSTLLIDNYETMKHRCNYLNRTWESYRYQTSMKGCMCDLIEELTERLKKQFMTANMYGKMTDKRRKEFETVLKSNELYNEYVAVKNKL